MVRAAIISNGKVINVAQSSTQFAHRKGWVISDEARKGDIYDGVNFARPEVIIPPIEVTARQAKTAMSRAGIYDQVDDLMDLLPRKDETRIAWKSAATFKEGDAMIESVKTELGITDEAIKAMFIEAQSI